MKKRVYGIENEYRVIQKPGARRYADIIFKDREIHHGFTANGARIYIDRGMPEYATPECASVMDLIKCEEAGNKIIFRKLKDAANILKSSLGWIKHTSGCHENYLIEKRLVGPVDSFEKTKNFENLARLLLPFLVSRQILCGAGTISEIGRQAEYHISQRSDYITKELGWCTTQNRSIVNTRPEPHASPPYFRLHLILGDANMSEISTLLKVGTTGIILQMIESGFLKQVPILEAPVWALNQISRDPDCKILVRLRNGRKMSAIDLQKWYLLKAEKFFRNNQPTDEEKLILKTWSKILDKLARDPMECDQEIDWVIKKRFIEWYQKKKNLALVDKEVRTVDYLYHHLNPQIGIYQKLLKAGKIKQLVTPQEIEKMILKPPQDTRAKLRGEVIKTVLKHGAYKDSVEVDWGEIRYRTILSDSHWSKILLEPFDRQNKKVKWLIGEMQNDSRLLWKTKKTKIAIVTQGL